MLLPVSRTATGSSMPDIDFSLGAILDAAKKEVCFVLTFGYSSSRYVPNTAGNKTQTKISQEIMLPNEWMKQKMASYACKFEVHFSVTKRAFQR